MPVRKLLIALSVLVASGAWAELPDPAQLKKCEARVDQALDAHGSKASATLGSESSFASYESRSLDDSRSTFQKKVGLLVYKAGFSKKWGPLSVNFLQEGGDWKIQQLRIDP